MPHLIIFDFDGTIADTLQIVRQSFNEIAPKYKLSPIQDSDIETYRNFSARELFQKFKPSPWKLFQIARDMRSQLKNHIQNTPIFPGIKDLLEELAKQDIRIGIVTSNSTENVTAFLHIHQISQISFIHSEKNIFGKDKILSNIIKKQKFAKKDLIYIGDEVRDVEASHKAGIRVIAISWGFNSKQRLEKSQPDFLVTKPKQILTIINKSFSNS